MAEQTTGEFIVKIPQEVMPLIEYAAKAQGWRPKIFDGNQQEIDNPVSAILVCFSLTVQVIKANAINALASEAAEQARQAATTQMETAASQWLEIMAGS